MNEEILSMLSWARIYYPEIVIEYREYERELIKKMREQQ